MISQNWMFYISEFLFFLALILICFAITNFVKSNRNNPYGNSIALDKMTTKALITSGVLFVVLSIIGLSPLINFIICATIFSLLPTYLKKRAIKVKGEKFDRALGESLQVITTSLRAGLTLKDSFLAAASNAPVAFADEAKLTLKEFYLGISFEKALNNLKKRVNTPNCNLAIGAMMISTKMGGKLPEMLTKISLTINERERVFGKLKALTAQGRMQAILVASAPPILFVFMSFYDKERMAILTDTLVGQCLLGLAIVLELVGIFVTKKIMKLKM